MNMKRNQLKNEIVRMVAASVMVQRRSLDLLHPSQRYVGKCISQLYAEGILRRAPHKVVRLTRYGVSQLSPSERALYMALSSNDMPGSDPGHIDVLVRGADILCMMYAAGFVTQFYRSGPFYLFRGDPAQLQDYIPQKSLRSTFILRKETKHPGQREQRMTNTRCSGYLYSHGLCCTVMDTNGQNLRVIARREFEETFHYTVRRPDFTGNPITTHPSALVICPSDDACLEMLAQREVKYTLAWVMSGPVADRQEYRYLPATRDGVWGLRYITQHTCEEIQHLLFSQEEIDAADGRLCDAVINDLLVVEFCSCRLRHLLKFAGRQNIGVVCFDWQREFVIKLWEGNLRHIRVIQTPEQKIFPT